VAGHGQGRRDPQRQPHSPDQRLAAFGETAAAIASLGGILLLTVRGRGRPAARAPGAAGRRGGRFLRRR
jgi:hypothetical protein